MAGVRHMACVRVPCLSCSHAGEVGVHSGRVSGCARAARLLIGVAGGMDVRRKRERRRERGRESGRERGRGRRRGFAREARQRRSLRPFCEAYRAVVGMKISGGCSPAPEVSRRPKRVAPKRPGGLGVMWGAAKPRHAMRVLGLTFFMALTMAKLCNSLWRCV